MLVLVITSAFKTLEKEEEVWEDENLLCKVGVLAWGRLRFILRLERIEVHPRTAGDGGPPCLCY